MSSSTDELDLLERVFLRIGAAETDEQFEILVNKFLIPVLLKLSSPNEDVRKKVMELLVHLNKRIKRRPTIQLPVEALLTQYGNPNASLFFINFSILYIKLGYPRLPSNKQIELAPLLLLVSEGKPKIHQDSLLQLLSSVIGDIKVPNDAAQQKALFKLDEKPELMKNFSSFMLDVLLLPYVHISSNDDQSSASGSQGTLAPPGMSEYGYNRVTKCDTPMTAEKLEQTKLGILKFLATGILPNDDIICHFIIAASDTRFTIANFADSELKRIVGSVNWSNTSVANRLFLIYLGTPVVSSEKRNPIPQSHRVNPANTRIRLKILPYLSRLEKEAILFPPCVQVVFNTLNNNNSNQKLQLLALNFCMAIVCRAEPHTLNKMGGMIYTGLLKLIWNSEENQQLRILGYTIIGEIVKKMPHIINKSFIELQVFFENLCSNQMDIRIAVRDSLLSMIDAFRIFMKSPEGNDVAGVEDMDVDADDSKEDDQSSCKKHKVSTNKEVMMMVLLSAQMESAEPMARFVAAKYLASVFDPDHVQSRYVLLLAAGDTNSDVSSVSLKSLYAGLENEEKESRNFVLPNFSQMSQCVYKKAMIRLKNPQHTVNINNVVSPFNAATFNEILIYLRLCLAKSSSIEIRDKELMVHPCNYSPTIGQYISKIHQKDSTVFNNYLALVEMLLSPSCSLVPISCLVEVVGTAPEIFAERFSDKLEFILTLSGHPKEEVRESVALLLSILFVNVMSETKLNESVKSLLKNLDGKSVENQHAAILTLGHIVERKMTKIRVNGKDVQQFSKTWSLYEEIILEIAKHLDSTQSLLVSASCTAFCQIFKSAPLPLPEKTEAGLSKYSLMKKLLGIINNTKFSTKIREKSVRACCMMCVGDNFPFVRLLLEQFLNLSKQTKDIDTHFSIGESVILCLEGSSSVEKRDVWKVKETEYIRPPISVDNLNLLEWFLDELIKISSLPHPNVRQFVCVFLISILKKLSYLQKVKDKLHAIQAVFMELLSENNELVQDIASKGLALVYENTTDANKKELVTELLNQLLSGRRAVSQVTEETKIFEEGQLGTTPSGGNLTTYKELCSLASELNQPDLIYKFMHLANHNAIWNSKKGAAFGFQTIALQANNELNEHLPKIIPRLYRYQFDPVPKIQQSMMNIWHSLVKDTQKTLDKYYNEILDDLLHNITSHLWRVRMSCALGLADFFKGGRSILDAKSRLLNLWHSLFRVMDDVHEGTRIAAQNTGRSLSKLCVQVCNISVGKVDEEMLQIVLSVFLKGITNVVADVRNLSLTAVSQLVDSAGPYLKPNLSTVVLALLEAAGEMEPLGLSYLSAQYSAQTHAQDLIDSVRASMTKSHFTTQTIAKCVQFIEPTMLETMIPKMIELMKGANLGPKIASAHLIVLLSHHLGRTMEQYTGKFLSALVNGLLDRNATIRKTYASTIGQILRVAKASSVEKLFMKLSTWYFEKEDSNVKTAIGLTLQATCHYNGDLLKDHFPVVLPLVFFAMHAHKIEGEDNSQSSMWEEIWNEITPGYETSIKQHMNGICKILESSFASSNWTMKAQAGKCIQTIAIKLNGNMAENDIDGLIDISLQALQGKTFSGKENIVKGLSKLSINASEYLKGSPDKCQTIVNTLFRECGKSDPIYKRLSLEALGTVLEAFDGIDFFQKVYETSQSIIQKFEESEGECEAAEEINKLRNEKFATIEVIYVSLGKSWPRNKATQILYQDTLLDQWHTALEKSPRDIQVAILGALNCYVDKLHYFDSNCEATAEEEKGLGKILLKMCDVLQFSLGIAKHTKLRKEALNVTSNLGKKLISTGRNKELKILTDSLKDKVQELEKDTSPEIRTRLLDVKDIFKN